MNYLFCFFFKAIFTTMKSVIGFVEPVACLEPVFLLSGQNSCRLH